MPAPALAVPLLSRLPGRCEVCRSWHAGADSPALCNTCDARFAAPRPRCGRCGIGLAVATAACGACLREPPPFEHTVCGVDYGFPWDRLIAEFKFEGRSELAGALATRLTAAVRAAAADGRDRPALVVPVPLDDGRLAERGYNQAWELARRVARALQLPADGRLLQRPLRTAHQATLGRADRRRNLQQAFMVDPRRRSALAGRRIALVDDVMTTGATAVEAATVLRRAGAAAVDVWALARTPAP